MQYSFTLESVRDELETWRRTRTKPKSHISKEIWAKTLLLLDQHRMDVVSRALSLTADQLKCKLTRRKLQAEKHGRDFVEVSLQSIKHEQTSITLSSWIEIKRADGASMIIEHLSEQASSNLLAKFVRDL